MKAVADRQATPWRLSLLSVFLFLNLVFMSTLVPAVSYHAHVQPHGPQEHHGADAGNQGEAREVPSGESTSMLESVCALIDGCHSSGPAAPVESFGREWHLQGQSILVTGTAPFVSADLAGLLRPPNAWPSGNDEGRPPWATPPHG